MYADIIIPDSKRDCFTYRVKEEQESKIIPGRVVLVPFKNSRVRGVVLRKKEECDLEDEKIKEIEEVLDESISTTEHLIKLATWISEYYFSTLSDTVRLLFPPGILEKGVREYRVRKEVVNSRETEDGRRKTVYEDAVINYLVEKYPRWVRLKTLVKLFGQGVRKKLKKYEEEGILESREHISYRREKEFQILPITTRKIPETPTPSQERVLHEFREAIKKGENTFLLLGATGSGKTMIYSWIIQEILNSGKGAIVLVPEIVLTPQITDFFFRIFGDKVTFYHSGLTDAERRWIFSKVRKGEKKVIIGPRSALFLPLPDPGIIVVDEEHETSYKEMERTPRYNARDVAIIYGKMLNIPVILGSATPSLESFYNAFFLKKYRLLELKERVPGYSVPRIEIIDMKKEQAPQGISIRLLDEIRKTLRKGKQVMLFLNRRGFSPYLICRDCGYIMRCPHCSVSLVFHKNEKVLKCHICGYRTKVPDLCPECGSSSLKLRGIGTQKVEEAVRAYFEDVNTARMDLDAVSERGISSRLYEEFYNGTLKILVGTKMLGKGFDFPNLGLVGVINADIGLGTPDFRAEERSFQLLYQVAGRIRRGGKVIIQTYVPESRAIRSLKDLNYKGFAFIELQDRKKYGYPPFRRITSIEIEGKDQEKTLKFSQELAKMIEEAAESEMEILGPSTCPREKIKGKYRYRILLKYKKYESLKQALHFLPTLKTPSSITVKVDVDPVDLM